MQGLGEAPCDASPRARSKHDDTRKGDKPKKASRSKYKRKPKDSDSDQGSELQCIAEQTPWECASGRGARTQA